MTVWCRFPIQYPLLISLCPSSTFALVSGDLQIFRQRILRGTDGSSARHQANAVRVLPVGAGLPKEDP